MEALHQADSQSNLMLVIELQTICDKGDIAAFDQFMCSPKGYKFGIASTSSKYGDLLSRSMYSAVEYDQWDMLKHVIRVYTPTLRNAIDSLIILDRPPFKNTGQIPTKQWAQNMIKLLNEILLPIHPYDTNYINQMKEKAVRNDAWGVWIGLHLGDNNIFNEYLKALNLESNTEWFLDSDFWFPLMLELSDDRHLFIALQSVMNFHPKFKAYIEEEIELRTMVRAITLQGGHPRLGANSPLNQLDKLLLTSVVEQSLPKE
jgi:hypothetical protein